MCARSTSTPVLPVNAETSPDGDEGVAHEVDVSVAVMQPETNLHLSVDNDHIGSSPDVQGGLGETVDDDNDPNWVSEAESAVVREKDKGQKPSGRVKNGKRRSRCPICDKLFLNVKIHQTKAHNQISN